MGGEDLPVDLERLRRHFPELTDEDVDAYAAVTRRVLADPKAKGKIMGGLMALARLAREKDPAGASLTEDERLAVRYVQAVEKMQRSQAR